MNEWKHVELNELMSLNMFVICFWKLQTQNTYVATVSPGCLNENSAAEMGAELWIDFPRIHDLQTCLLFVFENFKRKNKHVPTVSPGCLNENSAAEMGAESWIEFPRIHDLKHVC